MGVTVDHQPLAVKTLGYSTVGQVLGHLQRENRLVVHVLIDGEEPDLERIAELRRQPLGDRVVFIETADPTDMAMQVLDAVADQLKDTDRSKDEAVELLRDNQCSPAMQKLAGCFGAWQHAQESLLKTAQLLRIDLTKIAVADEALTHLMGSFSTELRQVREALECRDFVLLSDTLSYEMTDTTRKWMGAIDAMRRHVGRAPATTNG